MSKIIASLGHIDTSPFGAHLEVLLETGHVDTVRINTVRWPLDHLEEAIRFIRAWFPSAEILLDLGQKLRLLLPGEPAPMHVGKQVVISRQPSPNWGSFNRDMTGVEFTNGAVVTMRDGKVKGEIIESDDRSVTVRIVFVDPHEPFLNNMSGVSFPTLNMSRCTYEEKERQVLTLACEYDIEMVASSFIETAEDVEALGAILQELGVRSIPVLKIESQKAVNNIVPILRELKGLHSDGTVMIARGDLFIEADPLALGANQYVITEACRSAHVPFIAATGLLHSMMWNAIPSRAEVIDADTAVRSGAQFVMFAEETGSDSQHPIEIVHAMKRIIDLARDF